MTQNDRYRNMMLRMNAGTWILAVGLALLLNGALFVMMPHLLDPVVKHRTHADFARQVNVIRLKRPDTAIRKKETKPPEPEKKKILRPRKAVLSRKPVKQKIVVPFEVTPRLPALEGDLKLPSMEMLEMGPMAMKDAYQVGELDRPLTPMSRIPPIYPMRARRRGIEGWVTVRFLVTREGRVEQIGVVRAEPEKIFDQSVIRCVSAWRFKPGTVGGEPVNTWVETTIRFKLE